MLRIYFFGLLNAGSVEESWFNATPAKNHKAVFSLWRNIS
jgi:hypothetical protein